MPSDVLDPVLGDPIEVSAAGRAFASIALEVASIAGRLRGLAAGDDSWQGGAAVSAHARTATLPPKLDKANASYAAAGAALGSYARSLADAQQQSATAIANANRASADLQAAQAAQATAAQSDAAAAAAAAAANLPQPMPMASRHQSAIDDAAARLSRARAMNELAHEQHRAAGKAAAAALRQASHEGIHNESWMHHFTHVVGHWVATQWAGALRELSKAANVISALTGLAALALSIAGIFFPPLEVAAGILETISLVSAVVAAGADTVLAATGKGSWTDVGVDALTLLPAGLGKLVTKAAPAIREGRFLRPTEVAHASTGSVRTAVAPAEDTIRLSTNESWGKAKTLARHFKDHGSDFGAKSEDDYAAMASRFFQRSQSDRLPTKIDSEGVVRTYDRDTNTFASYNADGGTKTFYKPDPAKHGFATNWDYWLSQKGWEVRDGIR